MKMLIFAAALFLASPLAAAVADKGTFTFGGIQRDHYLHVPSTADSNTPLVIALHGMGGNAANMRFGIGLTEVLSDAGFAVVYPQGIRLPQGSRHWNAGFEFMNVDDIGYLSNLAEHLIAQNGLSEQKTMIFGISMGGYMAYHMACHSRLTIEAIVVVAGSMHPKDLADCNGPNRSSLMHIHGKQDPLIPFAGGGHWSTPDNVALGVPEVVSSWASRIGARPVKGVVSNNKIDETRYIAPSSEGEVQLLVLRDFGHDWPSKKTAGYRSLDDIVRFLARHRGEP